MNWCYLSKGIAACTFAIWAIADSCQAGPIIDSGWDLFVTVPTQTEFLNQPWGGVPLGQFDFGGSIGPQYVGQTDTIMRRPTDASVTMYGDSVTVPIELVALQLRSVNPIDPDGGGPAPLDYYYITRDAGRPSTGQVTINFDHETSGAPGEWHGWFQASFDVAFEMRLGGLNGPVVMANIQGFEMPLTSPGYWDHVITSAGVPRINGVNYLLNGVDQSRDFWLAFSPNAGPGEPGGQGPPAGGWGGIHSSQTNSPWYKHIQRTGFPPATHGITQSPEPSSIVSILIAGLMASGCRAARMRAGSGQKF